MESPCYFCTIVTKIFVEIWSIKFHENMWDAPCGETEGQRDRPDKASSTFHQFENASKNVAQKLFQVVQSRAL
jgi:hypothetical protein